LRFALDTESSKSFLTAEFIFVATRIPSKMSKENMSTTEHRVSQATNDGEEEIAPVSPIERVTVRPKGTSTSPNASSSSSSDAGREHGNVEMIGDGEQPGEERPIQTTAAELEEKKGGKFAFLKRPQFWIVLLLSQALAITQTGTNTLTTLLADIGTSIPAFQSLFNYVLLLLIYGSITIWKYGFKGWCKMVVKDGWRYFILAFFDVEGNYFTVLAYRYTTILSAQLINFWAIAVVVIISLLFLKVRYHIAQYAGILIACGGLGLLVASDHITGANGGPSADALKGDLFALLGATCYGLSNVFEEFLVSKRPMYEVIGQLGFWGMFINGVQAAIFDRHSFQTATWNGKVAGYLVGYTLLLTWFYTAAPIVFRMASAAFFNIGLLTGNFWGVIVGLKIFHEHIHYLYPIVSHQTCTTNVEHALILGAIGFRAHHRRPLRLLRHRRRSGRG
jgi:solute carrier family 35, member F1/2